MRRLLYLVILILSLLSIEAKSQKREILDSLTTIDPEIRKYFPRWKVCETDLQIQLYMAFRAVGYDEKKLSKSKIEILSAPRVDPYVAYDILLITCGEATMNSTEIAANLGKKLTDILCGEDFYATKTPPQSEIRSRDYCYIDIPAENPISATEADAIVDFLKPSNAKHAFTLSLFEQSLKIGDTGFWLSNKVGNDEIGHPFWSAGMAKATLQRPLYANPDSKTSNRIPYLIDAFMGAGYRLTSGVNTNGTILSWVTKRKLNEGDGGKLIAGMDFNMPFHPQFGFHINAEIPLNTLKQEAIDESKWASVENNSNDPAHYVDFEPTDARYGVYNISSVATVLRATGQISAFYYLWLNEGKGDFENFFRFDLGINYYEMREYGIYRDTDKQITFLEPGGIVGLNTYRPKEFGDWVYAKAEYRNQAIWPFGASVQYSNQTVLGRVYIPLVSWLYIEAKLAVPCRGLRPFENKTFFMISPVLRLTI